MGRRVRAGGRVGRALNRGLISIVGCAERDGNGGRDGNMDSVGLIGAGVRVGHMSILHMSAGTPSARHSRIMTWHSGFAGSQQGGICGADGIGVGHIIASHTERGVPESKHRFTAIIHSRLAGSQQDVGGGDAGRELFVQASVWQRRAGAPCARHSLIMSWHDWVFGSQQGFIVGMGLELGGSITRFVG